MNILFIIELNNLVATVILGKFRVFVFSEPETKTKISTVFLMNLILYTGILYGLLLSPKMER